IGAGGSVQRHDVLDDDAHGFEALAVGHAMGRVDAARGSVDECRAIVSRVGADVVSGGEEPEESVDTAIGGEREVCEAEHAVAKTGGVASCIFASIEERREQSIAGVEASAEEL